MPTRELYHTSHGLSIAHGPDPIARATLQLSAAVALSLDDIATEDGNPRT